MNFDRMFMQRYKANDGNKVPKARAGYMLALAPEMPALAQKRLYRSSRRKSPGTVYSLRKVPTTVRRGITAITTSGTCCRNCALMQPMQIATLGEKAPVIIYSARYADWLRQHGGFLFFNVIE